MFDVKRLILLILLLTMTISLSACMDNSAENGLGETKTTEVTTPITSTPPDESENAEDPDATLGNEEESLQKITIQAGSQSFKATIADNPTSRAFIEKLPLTLEMQELNGNEKFFYFEDDLPSEGVRAGEIKEGDLMLYGSDCLVLFYESFSTSYSYSRLGRIDDPTGLAEVLGNGSVSIVFTLDD